MKKFSTRFLTALLAVAILVAGLPMSVFAAEVNNSTNASATNTDLGTGIETVKNAEVYAVDEDIALRNSNTKYIRMSDGSYYVAMYNNEVHYQNEDGEWEEIDNTLSSSSSADDDDFVGVSTAKSKYNVKFANNSSSSKLVTIKDGNYGYTYDEPEYAGDEVSGLLESMTIDGTNIYGDTINYAYDTLQRLTTKSTVGQYRTLAQNYAYRTVSGNQTTQISNLSWTVGSTSAVAYSYTYDAVGNILTVSENNTLKASYTYDEQNQLSTETLWDTGIRYEYTYDTYGNIRSVEEYNANTGALISSDAYSYTNSTWLDRLTAFNGTTITYDNSGNPLSYNNGSAYTFTWDGRELASVVKGGVTTSYTYGADGLRTQKQYGSTTYNYYYVDGRLVRMTWANSYIDFLYDESGSVYSFVYDGDQYYFVKNLQGDVVQIRSIWGTLLVEYDYDAWGNCTVVYEHSSYGDLAEINPIRYRGYVYDFETGFYYLNSRYYDPQVKRFINADDASLLGANGDFTSLNLYAYCGNNPVARADNGGEAWHILIGAVVGAVAGVVGQVISDAVTSAMNGQITISNWQTYTGAALGGAAGGVVLAATGSMSAANAVSGAVTTGAGQTLEKLTIKDYDKSWAEIGANTAVDGVVSYGLGKLPGIKNITAGRNNWSAVYRSGLTKLRHGVATHMSKKVIAKGIGSSIVGGLAMDGYYGVKQHAYDRIKNLLRK